MSLFIRSITTAALSLCVSAAWAIPSYTSVNIGDLDGYGSQAYALNSAGHVVGSSYYPIDPDWQRYMLSRPVVYDGSLRDLAQGSMVSRATGINGKGHIVGYSSDPFGTQFNGFHIAGGVATHIPGIAVRAINDGGAMAGTMRDPNGYLEFGVYFDGASWQSINIAGANLGMSVHRMNNDGAIVGGYSVDYEHHYAYVYANGLVVDFATLNAANSQARDINGKGDVVGYLYDGSGAMSPFVYANGQLTDLGRLFDSIFCAAVGLNDRGDVVGTYYSLNGLGGFLYSDGKAYDLKDLVQLEPEWVLRDVVDINDRGQILANACSQVTGRCAGFRFDPLAFDVAEPGPLAAFAVSLFAAGLARRRTRVA